MKINDEAKRLIEQYKKLRKEKMEYCSKEASDDIDYYFFLLNNDRELKELRKNIAKVNFGFDDDFINQYQITVESIVYNLINEYNKTLDKT